MAFARAETAVQVRSLALPILDGRAHQFHRALEAAHELRGHHVVAQGGVGVAHALAQLEDEVATVDALGYFDQLSDQRHCAPLISPPSRASPSRCNSWSMKDSKKSPIRWLYSGSISLCHCLSHGSSSSKPSMSGASFSFDHP